ncbi:MAG TPA: hypothetical protein VFU31_15875 [Candidatus Binatia bacterium]|nr:hypothetical protein [Candidatus Binatia bacterium]
MRTTLIIVGGFILIGLSLLAARWIGGTGTSAMVRAAKVFIPIWFVVALVNMWMGTRAGYSVAEELPIFLLIFAAPAAAALFIWWKLS